MSALVAMVRLLFPWGELIIGIIVDTAVLVLGIFMIVTAFIGLLRAFPWGYLTAGGLIRPLPAGSAGPALSAPRSKKVARPQE